ncbi:PAS domain-containing sensor histidine kinase [Pikeienuella piscinae]|uniref:histidine kinase n=1 Tax=Pikeienuella piscinae TaxID=2748098 RepID=A0A7L5BX43_9RHOB|nr:PAS domain-containing sensor histidine kinase [Pikeienuella piscinae]QIE54464.1 PAS domain-containing sensor histidine kinase [Pikeienuella piscinae]
MAVLSPSRLAAALPGGPANSGAILVLMLFGGALVGTTTVIMNRDGVTPDAVNTILIADLAYIVLLLAMIGRRVWLLVRARRLHSAGARLHLRLTGIFAIVALAPTVIIAAFATLSINVGIETWFSGQVGSVVRNSLITAQAYADEHRRSIEREVLNMANDMNRAAALGISDTALAELLRRQQALRRFPEAYLIDGARNILHRGDFSYTFTYDPPSEVEIADARLGRVVVVEDQLNNELRALVYLNNYIDTFLYVSRQVDGNVLLLLDETAETVALYNKTEAARGRLLSVFALVYLGFALLVITTAAWLGLWLAERLSRPIGVLAAAAERVGEGDLDIKVPEENSHDEVALLSRVFNRMTAQVKGQRDALIDAHRESEHRRNFIETVLSGVSAGVIGLDTNGGIEMMNAAARRMLQVDAEDPKRLPEQMERIFRTAQRSMTGAAQGQVTITTGDALREFLVRVAARSMDHPEQGYVMTLDDLTALVSAQREAAWGDVARRIAHEIKNPLTPIQLSAERLRRKFGPLAGDERANFDQYADVIIRQAGDIRRMVDEFSKFARMPNPETKPEDISALVRGAILLQSSARPDIAFESHGADQPRVLRCDSSLISQALTNVLKNAQEAVDQRIEQEPAMAGEGRIRTTITDDGNTLSIAVEDTGVGLPKTDRAQLTEPYVTTREKGTGLGLAIVKKIAEQHGGALRLENAHWDDPEIGGARITLVLPLQGRTMNSTEKNGTA